MKHSTIFSSLILFINSFSFAQQNIWEPVGDPIEGNTFTVLAIDTDDNLYAGTYFDFFKSTNNGDEWTSIYNGYYVTSIVFNSQGEMFIGTGAGGGIFKSLDKGETWIHLNDSLISFSISDVDINSNGHLFSAIRGKGMYRSTDNGESWQEIINGLTNYNSLNELYIPKTGPMMDYLFVSVSELNAFNSIFRSSDSGESWEQMNFSDVWFWPEAFISTSNGIIYVGLVDSAPHSGFGVVYKSENYGYDWSSTSSGGSAVTSLILDKNEYIYAGTSPSWWGSCNGIIRTTNGGNSWESFRSGLAQGSCGFVLGCNSQGILFAGTETGFYRTIESTTDVKENEAEIPEDFMLFQNYPNPFNPSTIIKYQLPQSGKMNLKVYDLIGREIATLIDEEKSAGSYEITFDASAFPSGVYFYTLQAYNFRDTKKMILIK